MRVVACSISSHAQTPPKKPESALFNIVDLSLFLRDCFPDYLEVATAVVVSVWNW